MITGAALLAAILLTSHPAGAEVRWRSGMRSDPSPMHSAELTRAITELVSRPEQTRVVMHFDGPLRLEQRTELEAGGVRLLSYLGGNAYFATLTPDVDPTRVAVLSGALAVEAIDPINKLHPDLTRGIAHPWSVVSASDRGPLAGDEATAPTTIVAVYVLFHRDFDLEAGASSVIRRYGGTVQSRLEAINGIVAYVALERVADLAGDDDVMYVEPPLPAFEHINDGVRARTGADILNAPPYGLDGTGVTVMVYDAGTVYPHADLSGRLTIGQSDGGGVHYHATHVACTIGGDGGQYAGMAPATQIVSYTFEDAGQGFLYTDPGDLEDDYTEAISLYGADLSNNSIGTNTAQNGFPCSWEGNYGATGALIDEVVRGALGDPFRVVWANGNERGDGSCGTTYQTTAPPACAKNHLTVGALNSDNDSITSFTSWGPCDDGRLKPDISAPGCQSGGDGGVTSCDVGGGYTTLCGTSMASPATAGVAALLLQQFRESYPGREDFRNSLLRAVLAQTAVDLDQPGPDYKTGYGSIRAQPAADLIIDERFVEDQVDQDEVYVFSLNVTSGSDLKVTLAWDDPAGTPGVDPVLVNDLDLRIVGPDDVIHYPWTLNPADPGSPAIQTVRDGLNNIEQVLISNATPGEYAVEIEGFNIAEGPEQPFGVATSHPPVFCEYAPTFDGLTSVRPGTSCGEIELSWDEALSNCSPPGEITYNLYRHTNSLPLPLPFTLVQQGLDTTTFTDRSLEPGTTYYYLVRAEDSRAGEDANFVKLGAAPPESPDTGAPIFTGLQSAAPGPGCGEVLLEWQPAIETCSGPVVYDVHRSTRPDFVPEPGNRVATTFAPGFVDTSVPPGTAHTYVVRAKDAVGNETTDDVHRSVTPTLFDLELFRTGFEQSDEGWSVVAPNDASAGNWEWGDPVGTSYQPEHDATEAGVNCWITGLASSPGNGDVDDGTTTLLSAPYDMSTAVNPTVAYARWFTNDRGGSPGDATDAFRIDVSNDDGQSWTPLEEVGAGTPLAWVPVAHALPIGPTSQVRFRFSAADLGSGSLVEAGIDEFGLLDGGQACLQCTQPPAQTLCTISIARIRDDVRIDWSVNPVDTRAVVYHVSGCDPSERVKLGTTDEDFFLHEAAVLSDEPFGYRVTFVDECGNEQAFCGTTDCP
jgi:subtilisin family serine protease